MKELYVVVKEPGLTVDAREFYTGVSPDLNVIKKIFEAHKNVILQQLETTSHGYEVVEDKWDDNDFHNTMFHFRYKQEQLGGNFKLVDAFLYVRRLVELNSIEEFKEYSKME